MEDQGERKNNCSLRTICGNKLEVMRHRRVIDQSVCDHDVCVFLSEDEAEDKSRGRKVQLRNDQLREENIVAVVVFGCEGACQVWRLKCGSAHDESAFDCGCRMRACDRAGGVDPTSAKCHEDG